MQTDSALRTLQAAPSGGGTGGAVSSVFGRTGVVTAQSGDYGVAEITGAASTASVTAAIAAALAAFGAQLPTVLAKSTAYSVAATDQVVDLIGSNSETFTLAAISAMGGQFQMFANFASGTNLTLTIAAAGSDQIAYNGALVSSIAVVQEAAVLLYGNASLGIWIAFSTVSNPVDTVTPVSDADTTIAANPPADVSVAYPTLTAKRTVTLPTSVLVGRKIRAVDQSGNCSGTVCIDMAPGGSDTINGVNQRYTAVSSAYGMGQAFRLAAGVWVLPGGVADPVSSLPADLAALISYFGTTHVLACYDARIGVTSSGGTVSAWADARGAGFGPTFGVGTGGSSTPQLIATSPTYVQLASGGNVLITPSSSLFDLSTAKAIVAVLASSSTGYQNLIVIDNAGTFSPALAVAVHSSAYVGRTSTESADITAAGATVGATFRLIAASAGSPTMYLDSPTNTRVTGTMSAMASGNNTLVIGGYQNAERNQVNIASLLVLDHVPTTGGSADIPTLETWGTTYRSVTLY